MTDIPPEPTPGTPPDTPPTGRRRLVPRRGLGRGLAVLALVVAAAGAFALYGMGGVARNAASGACPGSAALAQRLSPLARGELAAVAVESDPQPAPALDFLRPDGSKADLADFRGRTVLLNLWATWCIPCRQEMPALDRLQADLGSPAFQVTAVNIDQRATERVGAFLDGIGVKALTRYADPTAGVFQQLKAAGKAFGMPTTVVVDGQGCLVASLAGPADWAGADAKAFVLAAIGRKA